MVATQRQTVCLDNSAAPLLRVVFDRVTDLEHGIETGFARHRGSDVAVSRLRPIGCSTGISSRSTTTCACSYRTIGCRATC